MPIKIVQCDMCGDLHQLDNWEEDHIFICQICVEILTKIKKRQCFKKKENFPEGYWLFEFDKIREERRKENK